MLKIRTISAFHSQQCAGFSLVELMISLTLGLAVAAGAVTLFMACHSAYRIEEERMQVEDTGRYALAVLSRAVQQAGYIEAPPGPNASNAGNAAVLPLPRIVGFDSRSLKGNSPDIAQPLTKAINGSDILAVRFFGAGEGLEGDGSVTNCAGFGVGVATEDGMTASVNPPAGWSIFYVANGSSGEPELYCKYRGKHAWATAAIARGVEGFQVLYGLSAGGIGLPAKYLNASQIDALDELSATQHDAVAKSPTEKSPSSYWNDVSEIKIGLLVRSAHRVGAEVMKAPYDLFGAAYADEHAATDPGTHIVASTLPQALRGRMRRTFTITVPVHRNLSASLQ